ncbi:MAG: spermine synthase [Chloroflexi bacterium]|nr:spermine synthase [Chloroflexota bacterium]
MKYLGDRFAKGSLRFAFLLMGFSFTVMQTLMARELLVSFAGNELSIGLVLGSWLILEAVGSGLAARLAGRVRGGAPSYAALQMALSLLLPLSVYAAFTVRRIAGITPGEGMGLLPTFYSAFLVLLPLGLVDGAMFTFGCRAYAREVPAIGHVYVLEAIGGIIGGLVFTYLFIPHLHSIQVILILATLNLASAASLLVPSPQSLVPNPKSVKSYSPLFLLLAASLYLLLSPQADAIHRWFVGQQWRGYNLVYYGNSIYGNVAAIKQEEQYTFFANGVPILTAPVPDITAVEELVHLPMLFVPQPRRVLVVSGGVGGVLNEILKYPVERVDYAELDPLLIEAVQKFPTPLTTSELSDPRVHIQHVDGRLLVRKLAAGGNERYDLVIVNLPYPSTLQLNRFYTVEFFRLVREILTEEGVVALPSPGTLTYMSPGMRNLNVTIYETLKQVFPHTHVIPGDTNLWLASPEAPLEAVSLETLVRRWEERALPTSLMTGFHVRLRLDERWLVWFWDSMQKRGNEATRQQGNEGREDEGGVNQDLRPSGLLYGLFYWNELFSPGFTGYFEFLERISLPLLGAIVVLLTIAFLVARRLSRRARVASVPIVIVTTGFAGMAFDLLVLFAFQAFYGYVYQQIGLLVTAFMAGLSLGGWVMTRRVERIEKGKSVLLRLEGIIAACWLLFPAALTILYAQAGRPGVSAAVGPILLVLNALAGFLVGMEFPLASKMYLRVSLSETAGTLYASDLLGAFLGSLLVSVMLLPALGVLETCLLVAVLKLGSLVLVATMRTP